MKLVVDVVLTCAFAGLTHAAPSFTLSVDWSSGGLNVTNFPTHGFGVRKVEAFVYPPDGVTYAFADIVNYTDYYYPDSYSSEIGVFSSSDGKTGWVYHGIVVPRGPSGAWDGGGVASPGATAAADGTVIVGYAAENAPSGGINRGIGVSRAPHPLGPYTKNPEPVASPKTVCGGSGRCDDVILQARPGGEVHLYHSVKGSNVAPGNGIRHLVTTDAGATWGNSTLVLSTKLQPGTSPAESIAGRFFPRACGGAGAMVLVTDGGPGNALHAYVSTTPGSMVSFAAAAQPAIDAHPNVSGGCAEGTWANRQIAFFSAPAAGTGATGPVMAVGYTLWQGNAVPRGRGGVSAGMTMVLYDVNATVVCGPSTV